MTAARVCISARRLAWKFGRQTVLPCTSRQTVLGNEVTRHALSTMEQPVRRMGVGWAHKPRPTGKPPDTLTGHRHCHDGVHRGTEFITEGSIHDKDGSAEEPYECESFTYGTGVQPGGDPPG